MTPKIKAIPKWKQPWIWKKNAIDINEMTATAVYGRAESRNLSIGIRLSLKVVFHRGSSSIEGCLPRKVVFHWRSSSTEGCLPSKIVFCQRLSSFKVCLPSKIISNVAFYQRPYSIKGPFEYLNSNMFWKYLFHKKEECFKIRRKRYGVGFGKNDRKYLDAFLRWTRILILCIFILFPAPPPPPIPL